MYNMLANIYLCTFKSDEGVREFNVIASSFGRAASMAYEHTHSWEDYDAFELINIHFSDICVLTEKSF